MPQGELQEHIEQLPEMIEILSGGAVKLEPQEDEDDDG
jgi:hypothetical protein